ncbi:hypothetical protein ACFP3T_13515 [Lactiplantibacillus dongliensis]|uniref:Uncharacterized protein n=1 Tax=Lactiplantibacillus dongliensis TaxID=2559919 RepID=A0ABW1RAK7_9LACO|nr:hypothetical protein [Lactiplantibacillus dongliensis]
MATVNNVNSITLEPAEMETLLSDLNNPNVSYTGFTGTATPFGSASDLDRIVKQNMSRLSKK